MKLEPNQLEGDSMLMITAFAMGIPALALRIPFGNTGFIIGLAIGTLIMLAIPALRKILLHVIKHFAMLAVLGLILWLVYFLLQQNKLVD